MTEKRKCNLCGESFDVFDVQEDFTIQKHLGFGTEFDGEDLELHLCCRCMNRLVHACRISPIQKHTK